MSPVEQFIWSFCRIVANAMTMTGLVGLTFFAGLGLRRLYNRLLREETTDHE